MYRVNEKIIMKLGLRYHGEAFLVENLRNELATIGALCSRQNGREVKLSENEVLKRMFTLSEVISENVYREGDVKKFREQWNPQSGSRIWIMPGHSLFTSIDGRCLKSCDICPNDFNCEKSLEASFVPKSGYVYDVCVLRENSPLKILVVLSNGTVDEYQYSSNHEWIKCNHFDLFINETMKLDWIFFHHRLNTLLWSCRKENVRENVAYSLYKRAFPPEDSEITEATLEPTHQLLINCPRLEIAAVGESFFLIPTFVVPTPLCVICNNGCQFRLCDLSGSDVLWKSLRYAAVLNCPVDFVMFVTRNLGMWKYTEIKYRLCHSICTLSEKICFLCDSTSALFLNSSGNICGKINLSTLIGDIKECYIHMQLIFIFTEEKLYICCIENGSCLESLDLPYIGPPGGIWFHVSSTPLLGVYTDQTIYQVHHKPISEIINSPYFSYEKVVKCLPVEQAQFLGLIQELIQDDVINNKICLPSQTHHLIQSKALLLAALHWYRCQVSNRLLNQTPDIYNIMCSRECYWPGRETKLRKLLKKQVECFCAIEREKWKFFHGNTNI